ncbi:hypothetical protein KIF53_03005 [Chromobacterium subtsugae]|uniref:Uncharacterized protein n=1 Tax=Chromobacterium subtsugae TaxID=251747 RepID=A0ABS7FB80_9NEIS|nr:MULTISPECIES: hypothetical protein [Chromobacterium]KUM04459.1 hypothetical protein Cv017_14315 [Chromobacterium subtsugae]KZE86101.1 hypothetical protein AWB61_17660 [Chromobacterium sp. F49]MBW7564874.1 hypothetical protein [Chromobacterium subtsugae]MBW8286599.1 hypothetical protein [Chromobacterium subtsugae]WSE91360.1 hypothetical protein U6115_21195 [Chromobacterium subtsugae]
MTIAVPLPPPARRPGRAIALAISALLHLLALLCLRLDATAVRTPLPPQPLRVRILPITPDAAQATRMPPVPAPTRQAATRAPAVHADAHRSRIALAPQRAGKASASAAGQTPRLTLEGLHRQMRNLEPENPTARPLPENPQQARLARGIAQAERADCKHAYAGLGLLAAPMLLKDALDKDNGCKW